jgi:LPS sulfotransferase NodH
MTPEEAAKFALRMQVARVNMSSERDISRSGQVRSRYIICSSPRSGSTLLGDYLLTSGVAGVPYEYLNDSHIAAYAERIGRPITDLADYIGQVEMLRTTSSGVFGMKAHYRQTATIINSRDMLVPFLRRFQKIIRIVRRNKLAQAVSAYRALKTGFWTRHHEELAAGLAPAEIAYDASGIAEALANSIAEEKGWETAVAATGQKALVVAYEDLVANPDQTLEQVFTFLEIPALLPIRLKSKLERQGDGLNAAFATRFLADIQGKVQPET